MNLFSLAFYRLIRNPWRSFRELAGIGLVCALLMVWSSLTGGFANTIYQMATRLILGHMQVHHPDFLASGSIYDAFSFTETQAQALRKQHILHSYRLYQYALASNERATKGARVVGLDPSLESLTTDLTTHLEQGHFLTSTDRKEAVLGYELAKSLGLGVNAELIVLGTAADGSLASEVFTIVGILKPISQVIDQRYVYIGSQVFRELFAWPDKIHELVMVTASEGHHYVEPDRDAIVPLFPDARVETWRQLNPRLAKVLQLLSFSVLITLLLIFIALGMLLLNLKLMTTFDRSREYGVMLALGLHPWQMVLLVIYEALILAVAANLFGACLGIPLAFCFEKYGLSFRFMVDHLAYSTLVLDPVLHAIVGWKEIVIPQVFLLVTLPLAALYPSILAARIQPTQAIQGKGSGL